MAYVNVAEWKPDQVTDWLKGLDGVLVPYIHSFLNNQVNGQQVLNLGPDDLEHLGVFKLGHQELILEAVEHLRHFHYELDRETLQILALRLSCLAHSLHNDLNRNHKDSLLVSTQTLADVANIVTAVKPLVCWLDRPPFSGQLEYSARKSELLSLSLEMATCGQRDRFAERPVEEIRTSSGHLAVLADSIIQDIQDPLLLQPASLELVTLKKRSSDDLGFYIVPSYQGIHQIGELKLNSAAHQSGKLEPGDEIVQINYQTVVGWQVKQVMVLFEESPTEVLLTVKKRPKHTKVYGQIYMKPYRLPSKKRATQNSFTRWHDNLPSPRPELLTIPDFEMPLPKSVSVESTTSVGGRLPSSSEEECELVDGNVASSPTSVRLYLPKPRLPVQRRATITGASPLSKRAPVNLQQFWEELKLEREWRGVGTSGDKPRVAQLIQDCESRVKCARKYSSFDSLKDRNACFLQDSKPDVVSSCQEREKLSSEVFASTQSMENTPVNDVDLAAREIKVTRSGSDEVFKTSEVLEKSTSSDDVFKTVDSLGRSSKRSSEIDEVFKTVDNASSFSDDLSGHSRNKSADSDNVFISDNEKSESSDLKVSSLKEKIELFSKVSEQTDKPLPAIKKVKPKVPARTFRLSPDKNIPPKVLARVIKEDEDKQKEEELLLTKQHEPVRKEKGKLDKSYSTPAYDISADVLPVEGKVRPRPSKPVQIKTEPILEDSKSESEKISSISSRSSSHSTDSAVESEKEVHGQIVETINKHLLRMDDEGEVEPKWKDQKTSANLDVEQVPDETETEEKIGKILETINSSLVERRKEMEREKIRKPSEGVDLSKTISQVCQEEILQTFNPSGFSSDKVDQDFVADVKVKTSVTTVPILPRVRITPPSLHEEIHGLPDVTLTNQPPETPKRKPMSNFDCVDKPSPSAPATFPRQKVDARRPLTPPEPPPRPNLPQQPPHKGACYRAMMVARNVGKSATNKASSVASPRALRKKNPLLAKHRNVSVKDMGSCECQGWLQQRCRKGSGQWNRGWFLIKGTTFYGFKSKEANRADVMISLPGFTVSAAEEVKSRKFAFKVYHTGTMFYFAADNQEELTAWVDSVTMATLTQDSHSDAILFSESEGEPSGDEGGGESCFSSPKMKKFAGLLSSPTKTAPQPTTSTDKSSDMQKKFGSLKKLRGGKASDQEHTGDCSSGGSSLDRKYLGFLGRGPSVPVPTAQFRSYRRVAPPLPRPLHQSAESVLTLDTSSGGVYIEGGPQRSPHGQPQTSPVLPPDMADYRLASLAKSNRRRGDGEQDTSGFVTLEALMLSRQEEERRAHAIFQAHTVDSATSAPQFRAPPPPNHGRQNGMDCVRSAQNSVQNRSMQRSGQHVQASGPATQIRPSHSRSATGFAGDEREQTVSVVRRSSSSRLSNRPADLDSRDYRDGSPEKLWIDSLRRTETTDNRRYPPTPRHVHNVQDWRNKKLKKAALYQPPPVSPLDSPGVSEESRMRLGTAFEMTLDQSLNDSNSKRHFTKSAPTPAARFRNLFTSKSESHNNQKSLLGSPRLHRAFFRGSVTRADSGGESVNSPPLSPPQDLDLPLMNLRPLPMSNPPTPDYPGLEYPPVFEPGTYSLSDASTLLRHRNREDR